MDELNIEQCHFIGIGGIGMSGLAGLLLDQKIPVSGSDVAEGYVTEGLRQRGAQIMLGHDARYIAPGMTIVYSSGISETNPEYIAAQALKCPILHRSDLLAALMHQKESLIVAGTHGKTTTSSLLTWVLKHAGCDPSFAVGGIVAPFNTNAGTGKGRYFIAEADESDGTFLKYYPSGAIVTNIDRDHITFFKTEEAQKDAFCEVMQRVKAETLLWCGDDPSLCTLKPDGISYGFNEHCQLKITGFRQKGWRIWIDITFQGHHYPNIEIALTGHHNALNGSAVFGLALQLGIPEDAIREGLRTFAGVGRRCEKKGETHGVLFLDDYAHHPTEIATTLKAIRKAIDGRRLIAVFQPHRYTRMVECVGLWGKVFDAADELFVTEVYAAGETPVPGLDHKAVIAEVLQSSSVPITTVVRKELAQAVVNFIRPHDVVVTFGAGDINQLFKEINQCLSHTPVKQWNVVACYGGRSLEHEVTLLSARNICQGLRSDYYDVSHIGITKQGAWLSDALTREQLHSKEIVGKEPSHIAMEQLMAADIVFPIFHGPLGEDGTIQGLCEMLGKAYVGPDFRTGAIAMDKALTKRLAQQENIPTLPFVEITPTQWEENSEKVLDTLTSTLDFPIFIKPIHLGSTIGVSKTENREQLANAITKGFKVDTYLIAERGLINPREIEFAVIGNDEIEVFPPGEILSAGTIYDYARKYSTSGGTATAIQAQLPPEKIAEGIALAKRAFHAIRGRGMARVDFFLDQENRFWLNEINPIPGFTPNSLYPKICEANGLPLSDLLDRLVVLALQRKRGQDRVNAP